MDGVQRCALQVSDVRPIMGQCLDALRQAHLRRVIHGSIHPRNILFRMERIHEWRRLPISAWPGNYNVGLAGRPSWRWMCQAGFIAPEQLTSQRGPDLRSDLWQLAAAFYYALSGCVPWQFSRLAATGSHR